MEVKPYVPKGQGSWVKGQEKNKEETEGKIIFEKGRFIWPVKGEVTSGFGIRNGQKHDGIDISALSGTDVVAADDGEVIYNGDGMRGYGNIIIIQHKEKFVTIYGHNKENLANVGKNVKKGELIAKVGNSGNSTGYHLHFEIRKDTKPRNPLFFLP
ncbi:MAG: M23 family metallopeptidase [Deltaproteobacteria bacterium]|nr:M23 family metallopeptidase [Deltaproteobacteria bacterium]